MSQFHSYRPAPKLARRGVCLPDEVEQQEPHVVDGVHDIRAAKIEGLLRQLQLLQGGPMRALIAIQDGSLNKTPALQKTQRVPC